MKDMKNVKDPKIQYVKPDKDFNPLKFQRELSYKNHDMLVERLQELVLEREAEVYMDRHRDALDYMDHYRDELRDVDDTLRATQAKAAKPFTLPKDDEMVPGRKSIVIEETEGEEREDESSANSEAKKLLLAVEEELKRDSTSPNINNLNVLLRPTANEESYSKSLSSETGEASLAIKIHAPVS